MVGEHIAQFSFTSVGERRTLVSLGLVGEDLVVSDETTPKALPVATNMLVEQLSTFGTHTEICEVENGEEA